MKCQKCGTELRRVGLEQASGTSVFITLECPSCHCRIQMPAKQGMP